MYQALYRKYRPQIFSDVVGQPHITTTLKNEINAGRHSHAYLFTGSRGTGKTTCAKIFAKAVNCLNPQNGDPCNECEVCKGLDNGSIMDVIEIDAASNNGVDNIRDLREEVNFTPVNTKYRVYIIDEVHMLSIGAFNALLKTLEEPPEHVKFVLATTEVHKLPATILSRCQRFDFHRIKPESIAQRLIYVAQQEEVALEQEAAILIARLADGALRDALSILDQCTVKTKDITVQTVNEVVGIAGSHYMFEISRAMLEKNSALALETIDTLHNHSVDMERLCDELINHFRNIMMVKTVKSPENLIVCTDSELDEYKQLASQFDMENVLFAIDVLGDALSNLRRGLNRRVEMEMTVIKLCSGIGTDNTALIQRIKALENTIQGKEFVAPKPSVIPQTKTAPTPKPMSVQTPKVEEKKAPVVEQSVYEDLPFDVDVPPIENMEPPMEEPVYEAPKEVAKNNTGFDIDNPFAAQMQETKVLDNMDSVSEPAPQLVEEKPAFTPPAPPQAPVASSSSGVKEGEVDPQKWLAVIQAATKLDKGLIGAINDSCAVVQGERLLISSQNILLKIFMENDYHANAIKQAVSQVLGKEYKVSLSNGDTTNKKVENKPQDSLENFIDNANKLNFDFKVEE